MFWHHEATGPVEIAFTDRHGGHSEGPFAALNLGTSTGDDPAVVARNQAAVADALDVAGLHVMAQVHGADVVHVDALPAAGAAAPVADALVTDRRGLALLVRVADCVPVLLADPGAGLVGAVHAGRVGLVGGVVPAAVEALRERGATSVRAWLGPRAGGCCYELPEELADEVERAVPGTRATTSWGTPSSDVGAGVVRQLRDLDVVVHDVGASTCTIESDDLYSHRGQGAASGRFGGIVVLR